MDHQGAEMTTGLTFDELVYHLVAKRPMSFSEAARAVQMHRPRVWAGAVGVSLCRLRNAGWVEVKDGKWTARRMCWPLVKRKTITLKGICHASQD